MLTQAQNDRLTQVGPGTPMGNLMRRYWHPIAGSVQMDGEEVTRPVRLLGEDLILYKTPDGKLGLIDPLCPHRGMNLLYGIPESGGIRCAYHGWVYGFDGKCLDQPSEPTGSTFKSKIQTKTYPVEELGGLIFAYLGPEPAPLLPRWDLLVWEGVERSLTESVLPCNWLQAVDNALDPAHFEHLHGYWGTWVNGRRGKGKEWRDVLPQRAKHHLKIGFERFEHGIIKRRITVGADESHHEWRIGHPLLFPTTLRVGGGDGRHTFLMRTPIDDTNTLYIRYQVRVPALGESVPNQEVVPLEELPLYYPSGRLISHNVQGQDASAWIAQGAVANRTAEHLGVTDAGIIFYRRMLEEQMQVVEDGGDPINVIRDQAKNQCIVLPVEHGRYPGYSEPGGPFANLIPHPDIEVSLL